MLITLRIINFIKTEARNTLSFSLRFLVWSIILQSRKITELLEDSYGQIIDPFRANDCPRLSQRSSKKVIFQLMMLVPLQPNKLGAEPSEEDHQSDEDDQNNGPSAGVDEDVVHLANLVLTERPVGFGHPFSKAQQ